MQPKENDAALATIAEQAIESVCIGQIAALAALRAEMTALSTMMSGVPHPSGSAAITGQPGARADDSDPEDSGFDNMPV